MNIVIEGCDGTGKTTIAKFLAETFGLYYWHESAPRSFSEYCTMLNSGGVVFDRFCLGQFVYNKAEERKLGEEELKCLLNTVFKDTNTIMIYVDCATEIIINRLIERGEATDNDRAALTKWVKNIRGTYKSLLNRNADNYITIRGDESKCRLSII